LLASSAALARDDKSDCENKRFVVAATAIEACTRLIEAGRARGAALEELYLWRMDAYGYSRLDDLVIADANHVIGKLIKHDPQSFKNARLRWAYFTRAKTRMFKVELKQAIADFTIVVRNFPTDTEALFQRGSTYLWNGDRDEAIADFTAVIKLDATHFRAYAARGEAHGRQGDVASALADLRRAIELDRAKELGDAPHDNIKDIERQAAANTAREDAAAAAKAARPDCELTVPADIRIEACTKVLAAESSSTDRFSALEFRAHAYRLKGNAEGASADYKAALQIIADDIRNFPIELFNLYARAELHALMGSYDLAVADYDRIVSADPSDPKGYWLRAEVYEKKGNARRAEGDFEAALARAAGSEQAKAGLARVRAALVQSPSGGSCEDGLVAAALVAACTSALTAAGTPKERFLAYRLRAQGYRASGDSERAAQDYAVALDTVAAIVERDPTDLSLLQSRAELHAMMGAYDRAVADLGEAIGRDPDGNGSRLLRAAILEEMGDLRRARADFADAAKHDPTSIEAASGLDRANLAITDLPFAIIDRGRAHLAAGDVERAIADFDEAIRTHADHFLAYKLRAAAYERKGEIARALADARLGVARASTNGANTRFDFDTIKRLEARLASTDGRQHAGPTASAQPVPERLTPAPPTSPAPESGPAPSVPQAQPSTVQANSPAIAQPSPAAAPHQVQQAAVQPAVVEPSTPAVTLPPATPLGTRVALVVGNGAYVHATRLPNPTNDAADIAAILRKLGFQVIEGVDLDKRALEDKVREFGRMLDRAELALFFYAGHGLQVTGRNYLVPVDAKLERPGDLNFDAIDVGFILAQMEAEQRVNLVFLDACRDNPLARTFARSLGTRSASVGQGLATIQGALGTMIAYATHPDAVALDGDGRNSPFTAAMIKHLSTPGLEIATLMRRVRSDVVTATRGKQVPWDHSSLMGEVVLAR